MKSYRIALVLLLVTLGSLPIRAHVEVVIEMPRVVIDGEPMVAIGVLRNASLQDLAVPAFQTASDVSLSIAQIADAGSGKCVIRRNTTSGDSGSSGTVLLRPNQTYRFSIDALQQYPVGLPPGEFSAILRVFIPTPNGEVESVVSSPVKFTVNAPSGRDSTMYSEFIDVCRAVVRRETRAGTLALQFARQQPKFPWTPALLEAAQGNAGGSIREEINRLMIDLWPNSDFARRALIDLQKQRQRDAAIQERSKHDEWLHEEFRRPENKEIIEDLSRLGAIASSSDFGKFLAFLKKHPQSFYTPEAINAMIVAIDHGIQPPGVPAEETLAWRDRLAERLSADFPYSYWAAVHRLRHETFPN